MFGQPDDNQQVAAPAGQNPSMLDNVSAQDLQGQPASDPALPADPQATPPPSQHPLNVPSPYPDLAQSPVADPAGSPPIVPPAGVDPVAPASPLPPQPASSQPAPAPVWQPLSDPSTSGSSVSSQVDQDKLTQMKQDAMSHLEPLVDQIDGSPEERFKTTMMMIQANDNSALLDKALAAAKSIENDKVRADALLDVINEINYFSQIQSDQSAE